MANSEPTRYFPAIKHEMLPKNAFKGKIAFITGGGSGLGKAMALTLSRLGAQVAIASRRLDLLKTVAAEIQNTTGNKVVPIQLNVKDSDAVKKAADQCELQLGLPNIIINNAAGNFISPTEKLSPNAFKTIVDIVLMGSVYVTLEFGKRLISAKQGAAFLAITTPYARHGSPFVSPSAASKGAVEVFSKSMAAEWGKYGMRFNCLAPGSIHTEGASSRLDPTGKRGAENMDKIPAGRTGETEELANLASYIVSDYASWMNGSIIDFDGGQQALIGGLFSGLHKVSNEDWNMLEKMIRTTSGKSKL